MTGQNEIVRIQTEKVQKDHDQFLRVLEEEAREAQKYFEAELELEAAKKKMEESMKANEQKAYEQLKTSMREAARLKRANEQKAMETSEEERLTMLKFQKDDEKLLEVLEENVREEQEFLEAELNLKEAKKKMEESMKANEQKAYEQLKTSMKEAALLKRANEQKAMETSEEESLSLLKDQKDMLDKEQAEARDEKKKLQDIKARRLSSGCAEFQTYTPSDLVTSPPQQPIVPPSSFSLEEREGRGDELEEFEEEVSGGVAAAAAATPMAGDAAAAGTPMAGGESPGASKGGDAPVSSLGGKALVTPVEGGALVTPIGGDNAVKRQVSRDLSSIPPKPDYVQYSAPWFRTPSLHSLRGELSDLKAELEKKSKTQELDEEDRKRLQSCESRFWTYYELFD